MKWMRNLEPEERVDEVMKKTLTEVEVEYHIGHLRKNKTKRTVDDLSKIYMDAKTTFHVLMCQLG